MWSKRVLVVLEPGRAGRAAVDLARELGERDRAEITLVSAVPQGVSGPRCGNTALDFNAAVREAGRTELLEARDRLGEVGHRATLKLLVERADPPLEVWIAGEGFDEVLLPARRRPLHADKHPAAARLRGVDGVEVRVVGSRSQEHVGAAG